MINNTQFVEITYIKILNVFMYNSITVLTVLLWKQLNDDTQI